MSSTTRNVSAADEAREAFGRSGLSAMKPKGAGHSTEAAQTMAGTAAGAADTMTDISSKMVEQGLEVMMEGVRTAAGIGGRVAETSFGRGHDFMSSATQMMAVYRQASEQAAQGMQALFSSWMAAGRSMQTMQQTWLGMFESAAAHTGRKPQDLLRCTTMVEVAEVQRDLYIDAMNRALESSSRLIDVMGQTARDAVLPLQTYRR
jgi:hypothetical protein